MKLTLERDNGDTFTVTIEEQPEGPLVKTMQGMCVLLDSWATERDKLANGS
jgi:hypothetical protein